MDFQLYIGKVISISDTDNKGKIQVKPYPLMNDILDADCPWVRPFLATATGETSVNIPPISSLVWILDFDNFVHNAFYLPYSTLDGLIDVSTDVSAIASGTGLSMGTFSDVTYKKTADGTIMFQNKKTGALGIMHNSGSCITMDSTGNIKVTNSSSEIEVTSSGTTVSGNVEFKGGTLKTSAGSSGMLTGDGAFLGTKVCLISGAPICGSRITCP